MTPVLLAVAVGLSAPAAKDPPKKDPPTIVGEWAGEKAEAGGMPLPVPAGGITMEFTADGKVVIREGAKPPETGGYTADPKKTPAEIDLTPSAKGKDITLVGIYKVEGDTLTLCLGIAGKRPDKFESPAGADCMLMTLKRAKPKKE
jgi:uncharacterized protein (TIGR03067 family)